MSFYPCTHAETQKKKKFALVLRGFSSKRGGSLHMVSERGSTRNLGFTTAFLDMI
jgi:hypothetical protein